jgi:hypothetical protein
MEEKGQIGNYPFNQVVNQVLTRNQPTGTTLRRP